MNFSLHNWGALGLSFRNYAKIVDWGPIGANWGQLRWSRLTLLGLHGERQWEFAWAEQLYEPHAQNQKLEKINPRALCVIIGVHLV